MTEFIKNENDISFLLLTISLFILLFICPRAESSTIEKKILISFSFEKISESMLVEEQSTKTISVTAVGKESELNKLKSIVYPVDLSKAVLGKNTIKIDISKIKLTEGIEIKKFQPEKITIFLAGKITKKIPVFVKTKGVPAQGYEITGSSVTPSEITISGRERDVESISECYIKPIDISGLKENIKKEVVLDIPKTNLVEIKPNLVLAEIKFNEKKISKKITQLPVYGDNSLKKIKIQPAFIDIDVSGTIKDLSSLDPEKDIRVAIDLKNLESGIYVRRASIALPVNLMLVNVEPKLFTVSISDMKNK